MLIDRDDGVLTPTDPVEREFAYVQAARRYPDLHQFMPERPPAAWTYHTCHGTGEVAVNGRHGLLSCVQLPGWTAESD